MIGRTALREFVNDHVSKLNSAPKKEKHKKGKPAPTKEVQQLAEEVQGDVRTTVKLFKLRQFDKTFLEQMSCCRLFVIISVPAKHMQAWDLGRRLTPPPRFALSAQKSSPPCAVSSGVDVVAQA